MGYCKEAFSLKVKASKNSREEDWLESDVSRCFRISLFEVRHGSETNDKLERVSACLLSHLKYRPKG